MLEEEKVETEKYIYNLREIKGRIVLVDSTYKGYDDTVYKILALKEDDSGKKWMFVELPSLFMEKKVDDAYKRQLLSQRFDTIEEAIREWEKSYE